MTQHVDTNKAQQLLQFSSMEPNCQVVGLKNRTETHVKMQHVRLYPAAFVAKISSGVGDRLEKNVTTAHADRDAHRHTHIHTHCC